jgi:ferredoxin-NADP reductase
MSSGFHPLKVVAKMQESSIITSFYLTPVDPSLWRDYVPGQFLTFKIPKADGKGFAPRNYSLSGPCGKVGEYRVSIKREADGLASGFFHDQLKAGDTVMALPPRGEFVLDQTSPRSVVLLSGGVGLTPMVSMLHELAQTNDRDVLFLHACENGEVHALRDEVLELVSTREGLRSHFVYRSPTLHDRGTIKFDSEGVVTKALLQSLLPLDDYDFYLCGPPAFMQAIYRTLRDLGVPKLRIAYEFFGPATVLDEEPKIAAPIIAAPVSTNLPIIEFRKSGITANWDGTSESLLAFAEAQGLTPEFSCRAGICSTCKVSLISGEVAYFEDPLDDVEKGFTLLCCSKPAGSLVLDL